MKAVALTLVLSATAAGVAPAAPAPSSSDAHAGVRLQLPRPTGPHPVGRATLLLVDHTRQDPWVPEAGARELMVSMSYPARPGSGPRAPYATTEEARLLLKSQGLEDIVPAETLSATETHSRVDARPAHGTYPLVVLSPGFSVSRYTLTALAEELASRGYVVAAIDHAYESVGTAFPGGRMLTCVACDKAQTEADLRLATTGRGKDVSFVVDQLTGHRPAWRHARLINKNRIGMAGHSMGGASAISAMASDRRIRAGVDMDGAFHDPVPPTGLGARPFMMIGTDDDTHRPGGSDHTWDETWNHLDGWKRWLTVAGSDHLTFSDWPALAEQLNRPTPPLPAERAVDITRGYVTAFFNLHVRHIPQPLLDGPTPANPEVRFHNP